MSTNKIDFSFTGSEVLATLGENIKLARIGRRLTVYGVSKMAGSAARHYGRLKRDHGKLRWGHIMMYCFFSVWQMTC